MEWRTALAHLPLRDRFLLLQQRVDVLDLDLTPDRVSNIVAKKLMKTEMGVGRGPCLVSDLARILMTRASECADNCLFFLLFEM